MNCYRCFIPALYFLFWCQREEKDFDDFVAHTGGLDQGMLKAPPVEGSKETKRWKDQFCFGFDLEWGQSAIPMSTHAASFFNALTQNY